MDNKLMVENLIKEKLNISDIDETATIATYGLDSLDVVEFLIELEDKFNVSFDSEDTKNIKIGNTWYTFANVKFIFLHQPLLVPYCLLLVLDHYAHNNIVATYSYLYPHIHM